MAESDVCELPEVVEGSCCPKFQPPMSIQRYNKVIDIYRSCGITLEKVVDFGCSEMSFMCHLKSLEGLQEIALVDVDRPTLESKMGRAAPLASEYIRRRFQPLNVLVYNGNVAQVDQRLLHYDAVSCIEIVEHLTEDVLECFPVTVFGFMRPKLVVVTTPNADFNVLFPNMTGFRHWDHKFEWTRRQFTQWCEKVVAKYPCYTFETDGVGCGPPGSEHLGCCTQLAVFRLQHSDQESLQCALPTEPSTPYILLQKYEYPYRSLIDVLTMETEYRLRNLAESMRETNDAEMVRLPTDELFDKVYSCRSELESELQLIGILQSAGYKTFCEDGRNYVECLVEKNESDGSVESDHELWGPYWSV